MGIIKTAVIIAGGSGERLLPLTVDKPKAMVKLNGKPILYWMIQWLKRNGIKNLVIGVAYKKEKIISYMKRNKGFGLSYKISEHTSEGGTAEAFRLAISRYVNDECFLGTNCDEITSMDISNLARMHIHKNKLVTIAIAPFHCRFSVVNTKNGVIENFHYGHKLSEIPVSIGIYVFNRDILDYLPGTGSIEDDVFTKLAPQKMLASYMIQGNEDWISVNTVKDAKEAERLLRRISHEG